MLKGTIKFFNGERGFGFIGRGGEQRDIFFHHTALADPRSYDELDEGNVVEFELGTDPKRGGPCAVNVRVLST